VTDANVRRVLSDRVEEALRGSDQDLQHVHWIVVEPGERSRSMDRVLELVDRIRSLGRHRLAPLLAVGGGAIADLVGFTAAILGGGRPYGIVPTSLTAQLEFPHSGEVGVSHRGLPDWLAVTHPPRVVLVDPGLLETLPRRQQKGGFGVLLRIAAARDQALFRYAAERVEALEAGDPEALAYVVPNAASLRTSNRRGALPPELLQPGHSFATAVRAIDRGRTYGEAAALGLMFAARMSCALGYLDPDDRSELEDVLRSFHLPTSLDSFLGGDLMPLLGMPEGVNRVPFVVLERIGRARLARVHRNDVENMTRGE
jgi:3-dehydroquinate synthetase